MDWEIAGWEISFCSEDCICSEFLGLYYKWMVSLPEVENELLCRTSQTNWSPSETLGWSNWIFCTGNFPFIMVSGGQIWDMELSWEGFCKVVLGMLMFGCCSFPCPSRTVALTRTGIVCVYKLNIKRENITSSLAEGNEDEYQDHEDIYDKIVWVWGSHAEKAAHFRARTRTKSWKI